MPAITSKVHQGLGPAVQTFSISELEKEVNYDEKGKKKKRLVNLEDCKLMQMVQYSCTVVKARKEVECRPLLRLFRQYVNSMC